MTTRVELRGEKVIRYLKKRGINHVENRFIIGEFEDQSGLYETEVGMVGLEFALVNRNINREVVLFCRDAKILRGKGNKRVRKVDVNKLGIGAQQLTKGVNLHVETEAISSQFKAK